MKLYKKRFSEQLSQDDIHRTIITFFKANNPIEDNDVHLLAEKLGIAPDVLESHIYMILRSFLGEGKSKKFDGEYDEKEVKLGLKVEKEHSTDPTIQLKIVHDHLAERSDYYSFGQSIGMFPELKPKEDLGQEETDEMITAV